jgi:hypothetical protein
VSVERIHLERGIVERARQLVEAPADQERVEIRHGGHGGTGTGTGGHVAAR